MTTKADTVKNIVTIGKKRGGPRPHMRGNSLAEGTHPRVLATRWKKGEAPPKAKNPLTAGKPGPKPCHTVIEALKEGLTHEALVNGKPTGKTVAEVIAQQRLEEAMAPASENDAAHAATQFVTDRTERFSPLNGGSMLGVKEFAFRVIYDDPAQGSEGGDVTVSRTNRPG